MGLIYFDIPELQGTNTEIALSNLVLLEEELEDVMEKRLAHLSELARAILKDGGDEDIVRSIILSIKSDGTIQSKNIADLNRKDISALFSGISLVERLTIFKNVFDTLATEKKNTVRKMLMSEDVELPENAKEKIAYLKNSYTDAAYIQFSSLLDDPRVVYYDSVIGVCESVYNDQCEYCILPIETARDGRLGAFYEMILKYALRINAVYDLTNDKECTRYALLSKNIISGITIAKARTKNRFFEFVLTDNDGITLKDILVAAEFCSLELQRIDMLRINDQINRATCSPSPVFKTTGSDMRTFLSFMSVDCPDYRIIGHYVQL